MSDILLVLIKDNSLYLKVTVVNMNCIFFNFVSDVSFSFLCPKPYYVSHTRRLSTRAARVKVIFHWIHIKCITVSNYQYFS